MKRTAMHELMRNQRREGRRPFVKVQISEETGRDDTIMVADRNYRVASRKQCYYVNQKDRPSQPSNAYWRLIEIWLIFDAGAR